MEDNYVRKATILKVIDGDTYDMLVDLGFFTQIKIRVRLLGVNTPEIRGEEMEKGYKAKAYVEGIMRVGSEVQIKSIKEDSFGRWLAEVYCLNGEGDRFSLAKHLLKLGFAQEYRK